MDTPLWLSLLGLVLASSFLAAIVTGLIERRTKSNEGLRTGYAGALRAVAHYHSYPDRVARRVSDDPEALAALQEGIAKAKDDLAYHAGWIATDSSAMAQLYAKLTADLRADVNPRFRAAWESPPRRTAASMNQPLPGTEHTPLASTPGVYALQFQFADAMRYRFGWRRAFVPSFMIKHRFKLPGRQRPPAIAPAVTGQS